MLVPDLAAPLRIWLLPSVPGKAAEDSASTWYPAPNRTLLAPGPQSGPTLAVEAIWEVNRWIKDLPALPSCYLPFKEVNLKGPFASKGGT